MATPDKPDLSLVQPVGKLFKPGYVAPPVARAQPASRVIPMGPPAAPINPVEVARAAGYPTEREKYQVPGLAPTAEPSTILGRPANTSLFAQNLDKVRPAVALADVAVPGSSTASTSPMVAGPQQSEAAQRTNAPATSTDREAYQMDDAAKTFTMIPDEGRDTSTALDASGNYVQGANKPGGALNVAAGPAANTPGYADMTNEQKIAANVAAYEARGAAAKERNAANVAQAPARNQQAPLTARQQFAEDMNDYNSGRVGSEGYRRMRNMRMQRESAVQDLPLSSARNTALAEVALNPFGDEPEEAGLTNSDRLGAARLDWDTQFKSQEAQRKAMNDKYTRQKDEYQIKRDAAKDDQELRSNAIEASEEILESGGRFAEGLQGLGPELLRRSARKGIDPYAAMDAMNAMLAEDTPAMADMREALMDSNAENQQKAQVTFANLFARKQGWNQ